MNKNIIKNILVGVSAAAVIICSLIMNPFNVAGMIISIVSIILLFLLLFLYRKEDDLTSKSDIYLFLLVIGITGGKFGSLMNSFDQYAISRALGNIKGLGFLFVALAIAATIVLSKVFKKATMIKRLVGVVGIGFALVFTVGENINVFDYFILGAIVCFYLFTSILNDIGKNVKALGRNYWITLATITVYIVRRMIFPLYTFSSDTLMGTINFKVLPFYCLGAIILIAVVVIGLDAGSDVNKKITNDMILFGGLASLAVVIKCSVFFHFYYSWLAALFGVFILLATAFRHAANYKNKIVYKLELTDWHSNPLFFMIFVELMLGLIVSQICYGHVYFAGALFFSYFIIMVIPQMFKGKRSRSIDWRGDYAKSFAYTFSIALLACTRSITVGYSMKKILLIAAVFVVTAAILFFVDHNNNVGHNDYKEAKTVVIIIFALLMLIPIYKGGVKIKIEADEKENLVSNYVINPTILTVNAKAQGKGNEVESLKYVFSDNYTYNPSQIIEVEDDEITVELSDSHLIIWATDTKGMETRRDYWFELYPNMNADPVGTSFLNIIDDKEIVKNGQKFSIYDQHFNDRIEYAHWSFDEERDLEPGIYYRDTAPLSFIVDVEKDYSAEIYYAYYFSYDKEFDYEELETPVYSYTISPKDNRYNFVCRANINPGYYYLVISSDEDSITEPYIVANARVLNEEAPKAEIDINYDPNKAYIENLPDDLVSYDKGFVEVKTSLFDTSYSELNDMPGISLDELREWEEDDLEADSVAGYGTLAFKFYDEICVSLVYAYSNDSFDLENLKDIYTSHLGECDIETYDDDSGDLIRCDWFGTDVNTHLYYSSTDKVCYVEIESAASVIED